MRTRLRTAAGGQREGEHEDQEGEHLPVQVPSRQQFAQ